MARMIAGLFCRANSMALDPICGMTVDESTGRHAERDGQMFYFCSEHCRQRFLADKHQAEPGHARAHHEHPQAPAKQPSPGKYICPMCAGVASDRPGNCPKCGMALEPARPPAAKHKVVYTCPMHPEIEKDQPGSCPICGMDLEPESFQPETEDSDAELHSMTRRFWAALALTLPVLLLAMLPMAGVPVDRWLGPFHAWLQLILAAPVVLWAGWPFFERGW